MMGFVFWFVVGGLVVYGLYRLMRLVSGGIGGNYRGSGSVSSDSGGCGGFGFGGWGDGGGGDCGGGDGGCCGGGD